MRLEFTAATKREAWLRSGYACEGILENGERCNISLRQKAKEFDHDIACWFAGANDLSNCRVLCIPCHKAKTRKDARLIAKSRRISDRHNGIRKRSTFACSRSSRFKKKVDGSVVLR